MCFVFFFVIGLIIHGNKIGSVPKYAFSHSFFHSSIQFSSFFGFVVLSIWQSNITYTTMAHITKKENEKKMRKKWNELETDSILVKVNREWKKWILFALESVEMEIGKEIIEWHDEKRSRKKKTLFDLCTSWKRVTFLKFIKYGLIKWRKREKECCICVCKKCAEKWGSGRKKSIRNKLIELKYEYK